MNLSARCTVGEGGSVGFGPAQLTSALVARFGAALQGLWLGEDIVADEFGNITSWPGRVGGALINLSANRFALGSGHGRKARAPGNIAEVKCLGWSAGAAEKCAIVVADFRASSVTDYETLAESAPEGSNCIMRAGGISAFQSIGGWTHFVDTVATEDIPVSGTHIIEGVKPTNANTGVGVGGLSFSAVRTWPENIYARASITRVQTAGERTDTFADLKRYYHL